MLALPKAGRPLTLDVDASAYQLGCTFPQEEDQAKKQPFGYWSRELTPAGLKYFATKRGCLGIVRSVLTLRHFLEGPRYTIR